MSSQALTTSTMELVKRSSWPARESGVMVVLCIAGIVIIGLLGLFIYRFIARKRAASEAKRLASQV
jgi:hypothetical protein